MNRNGKTHHSTHDTLTMLGTSDAVLGTPAAVLGTSDAVLGMPDAVLGMPAAALGTPDAVLGMPDAALGASRRAKATASRRQVTVFGANHSMARRLATAQLAINAVLADSDLQAVLSKYGYGVQRMAEGNALRNQALTLQQQQRARYGDLYGAADARTSAYTQAQRIYKQHLLLARVALRGDRGATQKLGLNAPRQTTQAGWLLQAQQFYANALADTVILGALTAYNLTQVELASGQAQVAAVADSAIVRQTTQSTAQATTRARDAALQALNRWMMDFIAIARSVLADQPHWLHQMGLTGR